MSEGGQHDVLHAASLSAALLVALMIVWATLGHRFAASTRFAGEGSAACLLGLVVGLALLLWRTLSRWHHDHDDHDDQEDLLQDMLSFDPANFFVFLLPPIIFYAGLSVKKKHFFRNFFTIAGYGILGTYFCFAFISLGLYIFLRSYLTFGDCLALGSILAATDSVAALQVISQERFPLLYSVVFGEGVLNDATSIVILGTIQKFGLDSTEDLTFGVVCMMLVDFLYLFIASGLLGMVFGLLTAFCLRTFHFNHVSQEVALIGMTAYLSYLAGDVFGLSGILALFVCAVAISHYALHNISAESRTTTIYAFHTLSYISEGVIFVYCGLDALDPQKWRSTKVGEVAWMFWILLILLLVSRAVFVVPVTLAHNRYSDNKLTLREMATIWWAGLMRGAVSVALVYYFYDPHGGNNDEQVSTVITTTMVVVLISILLFGAATKPLLEYLMGPADDSAQRHAAGSVEMRSGGGHGGQEYAPLSVAEGQEGMYSDGPHWSNEQQAPGQVQGFGTMQRRRPSQEPSTDFGPMAGVRSRSNTGELAEVAIVDGGTLPPGLPAGAAKGKQAAGGRPSIQLSADSRAFGPGTAGTSGPGLPTSGTLAPARVERLESGGLDYAPESRAVMARINRWWKNFDEGYMQPKFGGPASRAASSNNLAAVAAAGDAHGGPSHARVQASNKSFSVPVSRPGG